MTLRHLEILLAVTDCGSMRAAADQLYISQPSVSGAIGEIEREYGVLLFERLGKRLFITPAGAQMAEHARHLLALFRQMEEQARSRSQNMPLRIGATVTAGTCLLSPILDAFHALMPAAAEPSVLIDNTAAVEARLLRNELDIGLVEGRVQSDSLLAQPVIPDELILLAPSGHPLAAKKEVHLSMLEGLPFLMRETGSGTRILFEQALAQANCHIREQWVSSNTEAILNAVESGRGLTAISRWLALPRVSQGRAVELPLTGCDLRRAVDLVWHRDKYLSPLFSAFRAACQQFASENPF